MTPIKEHFIRQVKFMEELSELLDRWNAEIDDEGDTDNSQEKLTIRIDGSSNWIGDFKVITSETLETRIAIRLEEIDRIY